MCKEAEDQTIEATRTATALKKLVGAVRYRFAYPEIEKSLKLTGANKSILLKTLRAVIGTLDPTRKHLEEGVYHIRFLLFLHRMY